MKLIITLVTQFGGEFVEGMCVLVWNVVEGMCVLAFMW